MRTTTISILLFCLILQACSLLMIGKAPNIKKNTYYKEVENQNNNCKVRCDGIYVHATMKSDTVYNILRFFPDRRISSISSKQNPDLVNSSSYLSKEGFYSASCDTVKFHIQTRYKLEIFGNGVIFTPDSLKIEVISKKKKMESREQRLYLFRHFKKP